jgi:E3 ubiquitin-protein ligase DOA10
MNTKANLAEREVALKVAIAEGTPNADNPEEIDTEFTCRICYLESYTKEDPLISACSCSGTCRFIHINCLKQWLETKLTKREDPHVLSYHWKSLKCEL